MGEIAAHRSDWHDLSTNLPGAAARAQAVVELAAMRERTRVGTFLARRLDLKTDERAWRRGADGEEAVAKRLAKLDSGSWRVLHSVPVGAGDSDIDHVVIGPGGVYTLNTKNHLGKNVVVNAKYVRVDGHPQQYVRNSIHESDRAARLLSARCGFPVPVTGVVVMLADELVVKAQPSGVHVVGRRDIARWLKKRPVTLGADDVQRIFEQARRSTTWRT